jgi:cytidine deaminase
MGGAAAVTAQRDTLIAAARAAASLAYAPYSNFHVGAALAFADGTVVTGSNVENASYGLSLCAETVAAARAMSDGLRAGLVAVAVTGGKPGAAASAVTPCGRCRQVLSELAQLDGSDPVIWCTGGEDVLELRLSELLPHAFGPATLAARLGDGQANQSVSG